MRAGTRVSRFLSWYGQPFGSTFLASRASPEGLGESGSQAPKLRKVGTPSRKSSRPARLRRLQEEARDLLDDYSAWQEAVPENLEGSPTSERLQETVAALEQACELLDAIEPPQGYGRD
jgi:hypothetical protein